MKSLYHPTPRALRTALLVLIAIVAGTANAQTTFQVDNLNYSINADGQSVTVTGHKDGTNASGELSIPNSVLYQDNYYPVTHIGVKAFMNCSNFNGSLTIGNSVTSIGDLAFDYCSGFNGTLTIPNSVTSIGENAFQNCSGFTGNLTIPNSVTHLGGGAFQNCSGFTGSLSIPNSITYIPVNAFAYCSGFNGTLTIPNSVTYINQQAFYGCSSFTGSLTIPNSVTDIGELAFKDCPGFTGTLTIGNSVLCIWNSAFEGCSGLSSIVCEASTPPEAFSGQPFSGWSPSTPVFVPCGSGNVYQGWFGFTNIAEMCFMVGDLNYSINDDMVSVTVTGHRLGTYATGSLSIPDSVLYQGNYYPVTAIGEYAFDNCSNLRGSLTIPNSVTSIGMYAFNICFGFTGDLTIGNSVTEIGRSAFFSCNGFTGSLTLGNSVTEIGPSAFMNCFGFTGSLIIPNSVTEIGPSAFNNSSFTSIESMVPVPPTLGSNVFGAWSSTTPVSVPCGSGEAYQGWGGFTNITEDCPPLTSDPDTLDLGYRPAGAWMQPYTFTLISHETEAMDISFMQLNSNASDALSIDLGDLSFPIHLDPNESVTLGITWGNQPSSVNGKLSVVHNSAKGTREMTVFPLKAEVYTPATGDVWENPKVVNSFPYNDTLNATTIPLYDNYMLPDTNLLDGNDVVYKLELNEKALLYASVTSGDNGKVVLYEEGFQGVGGPDEGNAINGQRSAVNDPASIDSLFVPAGTYYLVASSTSDEFSVSINAEALPCPDTATMISPANNAIYVNEVNTELSWELGEYTTQYCLCFGTNPNSLDTLVPWTRNLSNQYLFSEPLSLSTTYYWQVGERNVGCPEGVFSPTWKFYTYYDLDYPQYLNVSNSTTYDDETFYLNWNAVGDNMFQHYNVYRDGVLIGSTTYTSYDDGPLAYNMSGYFYYVTAVYDPGESGPSDPVTVQVSGRGYVNGFVLDEDGENGIANATITFEGQDEFGVYHTYLFNTNAQGYYSGQVYAGSYSGSATAQHHQSVNEPLNGNPVAVGYNQTTSPVNYLLNWNRYEIAAMAEPDEGGTVTGAGTYIHGNTATLVATSNPAYLFLNWTVNDSVVSTSDTLEVYVTQDSTFVAHFVLNDFEIAATAEPLEAGTVTGAGTYHLYDTCSLVASPSTGYHLASWTMNDSVVSTSDTLEVIVTQDSTFVAHFEINSYTLTINYQYADGTQAAPTHTEPVNYNAPYSVTSPDITGYTPDLAVVSGTMGTENVTVNVTYNINSYEITATVNPTDGGSVEGTGTYNHFETCTLTAIPAIGYHFVSWTKDGDVVSTNSTYSFTVEAAEAYVANFTSNIYQVTLFRHPAEGGTVTGHNTYHYGESCTIEAFPNEGYSFVNWIENDSIVVSTTPIYQFTVTHNVAYVAYFEINSYEVTVAAVPEEGGTVSGGGTYQYGTLATVSVMLNEEYTFENWTMNGTVVSSETTYTFEVTDDCQLVAHLISTVDVGENGAPVLSVYPNPTQNKVNLRGVAMHSVKVFDAMGQMVITKVCENTENVELDLSGLAPGFYTVSVRTIDGVSLDKVVIKK